MLQLDDKVCALSWIELVLIGGEIVCQSGTIREIVGGNEDGVIHRALHPSHQPSDGNAFDNGRSVVAAIDHLGYLMALGAPFAVLAGFRQSESASSWPSRLGRGVLVVVLALLIVPARVLTPPVPSAAYDVGGRTLDVPLEEVAAIDAVRASVLRAATPGSRVFIGTQDMRVPSVTPVQLYFLLPELQVDAYYLELPIGISSAVGKRIADDVRDADVLLLSRFPVDVAKGLFPNVLLGPSDADEAVRAGFCPAGGFSELRIMVRCTTGVTAASTGATQ